jgi:hypothetical protein
VPADPDIHAGGDAVAQPPHRRRRWLLAAAVAAIAVIAVVIALVASGGGKTDRLVLGKPREVSAAELASYAKAVDPRPVYWAGPAASGFKLELTEVRGQRVFVRYLTSAAKAGDPRAAFTTVATYPMKGAAGQLKSFSSRKGAVEGSAPGGGVTLYYKKRPSNVYLAGPGSDYLIEVFAPQPKTALALARSSQVAPVR